MYTIIATGRRRATVRPFITGEVQFLSLPEPGN